MVFCFLCKFRNFTFLYWSYDVGPYYWEVIIQMRKITIVGINVFLSYDIQIQSLLFVLVIVIFLTAHIHIQPFKQPIGDKLETFSLFTSFITFFFGQFLYLNQKFNTGVRIFVSFLIVILNAAFFLIAGYFFIQKLRPYLDYMYKKQAV